MLARPQSFLKGICSDPDSPEDKKVCVTICSKAHSFDGMTYLANWTILNMNKAGVTVATAEETLCSTRLNRQSSGLKQILKEVSRGN